MTEGGSQGLFVVVAVVIFGIFVSIAYLLFDDTLKPALAGIFKDGIFQAEESLDGTASGGEVDGSTGNVSIDISKDVIKEDRYIYAPLRKDAEGSIEKEGDVWVKMQIEDNNTLTIVFSGLTKDDAKNNGTGHATMIGSLTIPDTVTVVENGVKQTRQVARIASGAFKNARFTGDFIAPSLLEVGEGAFYISSSGSTFSGKFYAPQVRKIEKNAFYNAKFTGAFHANNLETLGESAFSLSVFNDDIQMAKLTTIGNYAFFNSKFIGNFKAPELVSIGTQAFAYSLFPEGDFIAPKLKTIGVQAFSDDTSHIANSYGLKSKKMFQSGTFDAPMLETVGNKGLKYAYLSKKTSETTFENLKSVGYSSFYYSSFTGNINIKNLTSVDHFSFYNAKFTGNFSYSNITSIGHNAFGKSLFDGTFDVQNLTTIGEYAFRDSIFTGKLTINNIKTLDIGVFESSNFTELEAEKLTSVGNAVFEKSVFTTVNAPNLKKANVGTINGGNLRAMLPN